MMVAGAGSVQFRKLMSEPGFARRLLIVAGAVLVFTVWLAAAITVTIVRGEPGGDGPDWTFFVWFLPVFGVIAAGFAGLFGTGLWLLARATWNWVRWHKFEADYYAYARCSSCGVLVHHENHTDACERLPKW